MNDEEDPGGTMRGVLLDLHRVRVERDALADELDRVRAERDALAAQLVLPAEGPMWASRDPNPYHEAPMHGPFDKLEDAQADADLRGGTVEPTRRIRLRDLIGDGDYLVEMLIEEIEDRSACGAGPDESWRVWAGPAVHAREGAGPALEAWLERWVIVDQFEPVPNPEKSTGEAPGGCA